MFVAASLSSTGFWSSSVAVNKLGWALDLVLRWAWLSLVGALPLAVIEFACKHLLCELQQKETDAAPDKGRPAAVCTRVTKYCWGTRIKLETV